MPIFLLTWTHLVAVVTLVGGLMYIHMVLSPVLKELEADSQRLEMMRQVGRRFRTLAWVSIITLILTGAAQMLNESGSARIETTWGVVLMVKLLVFAIAFGLLLVHDYILDPFALSTGSTSPHPKPTPHTGHARLIQQTVLALTLIILLIASYLTTI